MKLKAVSGIMLVLFLTFTLGTNLVRPVAGGATYPFEDIFKKDLLDIANSVPQIEVIYIIRWWDFRHSGHLWAFIRINYTAGLSDYEKIDIQDYVQGLLQSTWYIDSVGRSYIGCWAMIDDECPPWPGFVIGRLDVAFIKLVDNLEFEITVSNTTITIGEWIDITLTLRNIGTSNLTIWYTPGALFDVYYCASHGCFYYTDGMVFPMFIVDLILRPGQNYTETLRWNLYQYINGTYYPPGAGTYYLWGKCWGTGITTSSSVAVTLVEPAPEYNITIHSSPSGVIFAVDGVSRTTPWSGIYSEGASVSLVMPETHNGYVWSYWLEDGETNRTKTITMDTNITLTAVFACTFDVVLDDIQYPVAILSNSTVSNFNFDETEMQISFDVTGDSGTTGYCNATIPKSLLRGVPWTIKIDNATVTDFDEKTNDTHTFLYFTYTHESPLRVTIEGTWAVPEFPSALILPLFMILSLITAVSVKLKKKKQ